MNNSLAFKFLTFCFVVLLVFIGGTLGLLEAYVLIPDEAIFVRRVVNQRDSPENTVGVLQVGVVVDVVGCDDYKSDVAVKVKMKTGEIGYVSDGAFYLRRVDVMDYFLKGFDGLTLSCRGLFDNRKLAKIN